MTGVVDQAGRALLRIRLRRPVAGTESELNAWIDTGFTGELVLPQPGELVAGSRPGCSPAPPGAG